jgi:hypothetical protein
MYLSLFAIPPSIRGIKGALASRKAQEFASTVRDLSTEELAQISKIDMNRRTRKIKNTVKLAFALTRHDDQPVSFQHLAGALRAQGYNVEHLLMEASMFRQWLTIMINRSEIC